MPSQKQQVIDLLKAIGIGAPEPVDVIDAHNYIQHNLGAADGVAGFQLLQEAAPQGSHVNTVRIFQDGEYVFAHSQYNVFGPQIGFDVFRFENGKIVEHWDNLQETADLNPSGRSMIDGPTQAQDLEMTKANKALAESFVRDILVDGQMDKLADYCDGDRYIQHHPLIADGVLNLAAAFKAWAAAGIVAKYDRIHRVLGEGDFVLVVSEGHFNGAPASFYDLFRVENAKIAEHWDIVETIPAKSEWKNENGKY